jgi:hypothetical protein
VWVRVNMRLRVRLCFFQLRNVENISKLFGVLAVALKNNENI